MPPRLRVGVIGASGYTGAELLRLLSGHPRVDLAVATADRSAGRLITEIYPQLSTYEGTRFAALDPRAVARQADAVFVALPPGESTAVVGRLLAASRRVIDLGADFRLRDARLYPRWYHWRHRRPALLRQSVYGLPEWHRQEIASARLVANPGCYPTAILLGLAPAVSRALAATNAPIIIDAKSGLSGAGRSANLAFQLPEVHESLEAYQIGTHRHTPEIEQELARLAGRRAAVTFTPHLVPMSRGLLATIYIQLRRPLTTAGLRRLYREVYSAAPFVRVLDSGSANPKEVRGTNRCAIGVTVLPRTRQAVITSAIDNLGKGAAGQAIQNLNLMMGWPETLGLDQPGLIA
ncbi:MAG TPA: N-acetyl-gamma-glutamyl-phosphate reductase [Nitrospiria bacterium]|nr:N-acetyl-gamma-glutamyl-phosphate reductase [Nitrospiria bacterium]